MYPSQTLQTMRAQEAAARKEVERLDPQVKELAQKISETDWALLGQDRRQGVWRSDALAIREKLTVQLRPLNSALIRARDEHQKLNTALQDRERDEREANAEREWQALTRDDFVARQKAAHKLAVAAASTFDLASEQVGRLRDRLAECDQAIERVAAAQAIVVQAQSRAWLNACVETQAAERQAIEALTEAQAQAERAAAARPLIADELKRADAALTDATREAERAKAAAAASDLAVAHCDWNAAVAGLEGAWRLVHATNQEAGRRLAKSLAAGLVAYGFRDLARPAWLTGALR